MQWPAASQTTACALMRCEEVIRAIAAPTAASSQAARAGGARRASNSSCMLLNHMACLNRLCIIVLSGLPAM